VGFTYETKYPKVTQYMNATNELIKGLVTQNFCTHLDKVLLTIDNMMEEFKTNNPDKTILPAVDIKRVLTAGNIASIVSTDHPLGMLSTGANGAAVSIWIEDYANVGISNIAAVYANPTSGSKIVRIAVGQNGSPGPNLWDFDASGNLTLPTSGHIIVGGGIVGGGASPAPYISGFDSIGALEFTNGNSNVTVNSNSNLWKFDSTGNLTIPGGGAVWTLGTTGTAGLTANIADPYMVNLGLDYVSNSATLTGANIVSIQTNEGTYSWNFYASGATSNPVILYASLPAPTTPGLRAFISDSNLAPGGNFGVEISGGGGNLVPVFSDGANWCIG
jgi:hypothetical protein